MLHSKSYKKILLAGSTALSIFALAGCSSSGNGDGSSDGSEMGDVSPYVGTWASGCFQIDVDEYSDETVITTATTFEYNFNVHDAADCSDAPIQGASGQVSGTYSEGDDVTSSGGLAVREVDYTIVQTQLSDGTVVDGPLDGVTMMDLVHIDGSGLLYFGAGGFEAKAVARPTAINTDVPYTRQ